MTEINTIEWHQECFNLWELSLIKHKEHIDRQLEQYNKDLKRLEFFRFQIAEARNLGKAKFDREKFRVIKQVRQ